MGFSVEYSDHYREGDAGIWRIIFSVGLQGCEQGYGDFSFRLRIRRVTGSIEYVSRRSEPFTPADGPRFNFITRESCARDDMLLDVDMIFPTYFRCEDGETRDPSPEFGDYDPIAACRGGPVRERSVIAVIGAIYQLAAAYSILQNGASNQAPNDALLQSIAAGLGRISDQLRDLSGQLAVIAAELRRLPAVFRGIVQEEDLKTYLIDAKTASQIIGERVRPEMIDYYAEDLNLNVLPDLFKTINRILGSEKLVQNYVFAVPFIAIWLSASTAVQRHFLVKRAGVPFSSPWKNPLYLTAMENYRDFFSLLQRKHVLEYFELTTRLPSPDKYIRDGRYAVIGSVEFIENRTKAHSSPGDYLYLCADSFNVSGPRTMLLRAFAKADAKLGWTDVGQETADPFTQEFNRLTELKFQVQGFYDWATPIMENKMNFMACLVEPVNIWKI
jgi:hypothetical protein